MIDQRWLKHCSQSLCTVKKQTKTWSLQKKYKVNNSSYLVLDVSSIALPVVGEQSNPKINVYYTYS